MVSQIVNLPIEKYKENKNVLGVLLVGSSSKYYKDSFSDYDIEIIVKDSYYNSIKASDTVYTTDEGKYDFFITSEYDFLQKAKSPLDIDHWSYVDCTVVHDPIKFLSINIPIIVNMDTNIRDQRIILHYFEFILMAMKIEKALKRGEELNARLLTSNLSIVLIKLLFVLNSLWPPVPHWTAENLVTLNLAPDDIKNQLLEIMRMPNIEVANKLIQEVDNLLISNGLNYPHSKESVWQVVTSEKFRKVRQDYGIQ
jgi:hypothetical protein